MKVPIALPKRSADNRVLFYGYDVGTEWYIEYTNTHRKDLKDFDDLTKISTGIQLLRAHTRITSQRSTTPQRPQAPSQYQEVDLESLVCLFY